MENKSSNINTAQQMLNQSEIAAKQAINSVKNPQVNEAMSHIDQNVATPRVDLRDLINLGRILDEKQLFGYTFALRTLDSEEITEVFAIIDGLPEASEVTRYNVMAIQVLARAIETVNGTRLENLYMNKEMEPLERRLEIIKVWQQSLVNELFKFYGTLADRGQKLMADKKTENDLKN